LEGSLKMFRDSTFSGYDFCLLGYHIFAPH
jgi:hypothetical protein